jgi:hypothetical protein
VSTYEFRFDIDDEVQYGMETKVLTGQIVGIRVSGTIAGKRIDYMVRREVTAILHVYELVSDDRLELTQAEVSP